jgi:hypothetical protein
LREGGGRGVREYLNSRLVMEDNLPPLLLIDALPRTGTNVVAHNLHPAAILIKQLIQQRADNRCHTPTQNNNWDIIRLRPIVERAKARIKLNSLEQDVGALIERRGHGIEHLLEGGAEGDLVGEDLAVEGEAGGLAESEVVGHVVVGVAGGDGPVEVGEEDVFGGRRHGGELRGGGGAHGGGLVMGWRGIGGLK